MFCLCDPLEDLFPLHVFTPNLGLELDAEYKISDLVESVLEFHASTPTIVNVCPLKIDPTCGLVHHLSFLLKFIMPIHILVIEVILPGGSRNLISLIFILI